MPTRMTSRCRQLPNADAGGHTPGIRTFGTVLFEMLAGESAFAGNAVFGSLAVVLKSGVAWQFWFVKRIRGPIPALP
jgi:hypothetical protein